MRTKFNLKFLVALGVMLVAILVFNMNTVNAMTEQELYNKIPNDIHVNSMVWDEISNIIKNGYNLDITKIKEKVDLPEGYILNICFENANNLNAGTAWITYNGKTIGDIKLLTVHYKDEEVKNANDEKIATELIESLGKIEFTYQYEGTLGTGDLTDTVINSSKDVLVSSMKERFNADSKNASFKVIQNFGNPNNMITHYVGVFVNKVYYGSVAVSQEVVEKKEEETKPVTTTDDTTNIKLDTNTNVVPKGTTIKAQRVIEKYISKEIKSSIKKVSTTYIVYDIYLSDINGVKIQPNGNVKISIPIPADFDKSSLCVYRMAEDGTKTKYDVKVEGNYATFETNHFSTYVLAENNVTETQNTQTEQPTQNKGEKDDTPKTGAIDIIGYIVLATVVAGAGIVALKKKEEK